MNEQSVWLVFSVTFIWQTWHFWLVFSTGLQIQTWEFGNEWMNSKSLEMNEWQKAHVPNSRVWEWMNEWQNKWMNEMIWSMNELMNEQSVWLVFSVTLIWQTWHLWLIFSTGLQFQTREFVNERINEWMNELVKFGNERMAEGSSIKLESLRMNEWNEWMNEWVNKWMNE